MRIKLTLSYDGTSFCGWQKQKNGLSVQQIIEEAVFNLTGEKVSVVGSGRTDAGVHALGQKVHFDYDGNFPLDKMPLASQSLLPEDIAILHAEEVSPDLHAQ